MSLSNKTRQKAEEHKRCAELAEQNHLFNSAVSRYYYYCLLRAKAYIIDKENRLESDFGGYSSHKSINHSLHEIAKNELKENYAYISGDLELGQLKDYRIEADYRGDVCFNEDQTRFNDFLDRVSVFEEAMDSL